MISKLEKDGTFIENKRTGRKSNWGKNRVEKLKKDVNNKVGVSQRFLALKEKCNQSTICRNIKKTGIKYRKRTKTPSYTEKQLKIVPKLCRKLVRTVFPSEMSIVLDDEKYFQLYHHETPGNSGFYTDDIEMCPDNVKYKAKEKFPKKILVWLAISDRGVSKPFITFSKGPAINGQIYLKECLVKRLVPFLQLNYPQFDYVFWPDLARAHYCKETIAWMDHNVHYVKNSKTRPMYLKQDLSKIFGLI
jgi:hypothetical protein